MKPSHNLDPSNLSPRAHEIAISRDGRFEAPAAEDPAPRRKRKADDSDASGDA